MGLGVEHGNGVVVAGADIELGLIGRLRRFPRGRWPARKVSVTLKPSEIDDGDVRLPFSLVTKIL